MFLHNRQAVAYFSNSSTYPDSNCDSNKHCLLSSSTAHPCAFPCWDAQLTQLPESLISVVSNRFGDVFRSYITPRNKTTTPTQPATTSAREYPRKVNYDRTLWAETELWGFLTKSWQMMYFDCYLDSSRVRNRAPPLQSTLPFSFFWPFAYILREGFSARTPWANSKKKKISTFNTPQQPPTLYYDQTPLYQLTTLLQVPIQTPSIMISLPDECDEQR